MSHNTPVPPSALSRPCDRPHRLVSIAQLRAQGVTAAQAAERCRPGGAWQQLLPGVFLLRSGTPTGDERLHAALLYAARQPDAAPRGTTVPAQQSKSAAARSTEASHTPHDAAEDTAVRLAGSTTAADASARPVSGAAPHMPQSPHTPHGTPHAAGASGPPADGPRHAVARGFAVPPHSDTTTGPVTAGGTAAQEPDAAGDYPEVVITGAAALALHRVAASSCVPSPEHIDVLVPRDRRLASCGFVRLRRTARMPNAQRVAGIPVAPVTRALADAVAELTSTCAVSELLTGTVRDGHCDSTAVVRELNRSRLLNRPYVAEAVEVLLAESRALAENLLYRMVRGHGLPEPLWNVGLWLPGGSHLGGVDGYWPAYAVAMELDTRPAAPDENALDEAVPDEDAPWREYARKRERLERLGIALLRLSPRKLRGSTARQAAMVRAALLSSVDREPPAHVVVLPR